MLLLLLVAVPGLDGCSVSQNVKRTWIEEPAIFNWKRDHIRSRRLYRQWAEQSWRATGATEASCDSPAYHAGYVDGFTDFVYGGGNGEPPPVPPREFWNADLRNQRGQQIADSWFAGYRRGVAAAREGGYRELVVVRSSFFGDERAAQPLDSSSLETIESDGTSRSGSIEVVPAEPAVVDSSAGAILVEPGQQDATDIKDPAGRGPLVNPLDTEVESPDR